MDLCKCLKQNKLYARTALLMYCKIIEMINMYQIKPTYLNTDIIKLSLCKRVPVTVELEPPTGTYWKQNWRIIACSSAYISLKHLCIFASWKERKQFTIGWCYLKMNQRSQKIYKLLKDSFHLCSTRVPHGWKFHR